MPLYINTNVASLESQRSLSNASQSLNTSFQRLSSGMRINTAADDAAGLGISESLKAQTRSLSVAERNSNNAISMAQTAEGALGQVGNMLGRMREIAVQGANGDLTSTDRGFLNTEFLALRDEITRIADSTKFNGKDLLSGASTAIVFQVGINNTSADQISVTFGGVDLTALGINASTVDGATATNAQNSITALDTAIGAVSTRRADFGAAMNRLGNTVSNLQSMRTNMSAANSRIRDVDVAEESAALARTQVLQQASVSILSQANQSPQLALSLLR
ncbi:MAG: flagellin FliC [Myxococcales bacterium]|nr:flagellin FliC [Myxococcales bacterium]